MAYQYKFEELNEENTPRTGYAIIGETLFRVEDYEVTESWPLDSTSINDQIKEAREVAEIPRTSKIYVDTEDQYTAELVYDAGILITDLDYACSMDNSDDDDNW